MPYVHSVPWHHRARRHFGALSEVPQQLSALRDALETGESDVFCVKAAGFVDMWQGGREQMESHPAFVDDLLVSALVEAFQSVAVSWHALKLACLMARADSNALTLLRCGGVAATLAALEGADERSPQHEGREARVMQVLVRVRVRVRATTQPPCPTTLPPYHPYPLTVPCHRVRWKWRSR